jgi:hypothetical protein
MAQLHAQANAKREPTGPTWLAASRAWRDQRATVGGSDVVATPKVAQSLSVPVGAPTAYVADRPRSASAPAASAEQPFERTIGPCSCLIGSHFSSSLDEALGLLRIVRLAVGLFRHGRATNGIRSGR